MRGLVVAAAFTQLVLNGLELLAKDRFALRALERRTLDARPLLQGTSGCSGPGYDVVSSSRAQNCVE